MLLKRMNEASGGHEAARENKGMFGGRLGLIHWYKRIFNFLCFSRVLPGVQVGQKGRSVRDREQDENERSSANRKGAGDTPLMAKSPPSRCQR